MSVFAEGAHYDDAMMQVFGVDMDGMEDLWRTHIGAQPRTGVTQATPVPSATTTTPPTATSTSAPTPSMPSQEDRPTATAVAMLPTSTATVVPAESPAATPTSVPASAGPCLGAAPALGLLILFALFRARPAR